MTTKPASRWGCTSADERRDRRAGAATGRGRPVKDVASELGCSWHPVNALVRRWGEALTDAVTTSMTPKWVLALTVGAATVCHLAQDLQDPAMPQEINRLGRTIWRWRAQIANWHAARVTNAPTEAASNLMKRVKRAAFGFTNFANYRIRALLYAGEPNRALLDTLTPP